MLFHFPARNRRKKQAAIATMYAVARDAAGNATTVGNGITVDNTTPSRIVFESSRTGNSEIFAMSPDGSLVAAGGWTSNEEESLYLFDRATGAMRQRITGLPNVTHRLVFSADGRYLWLSGRYDDVVYRFDTTSGEVQQVKVGHEPHGLTVWPQPGRYSLGHTGNLR